MRKNRKKARKKRNMDVRAKQAREGTMASVAGLAVTETAGMVAEMAATETCADVETQDWRPHVTHSSRVLVQTQSGLTPKGRPTHKSFNLPRVREDATEAQIIAAIDALRVILEDPISGASHIKEKVSHVLGPTMRVEENENEESLSSLLRKREAQQSAQAAVGASSVQTAIGTASALPMSVYTAPAVVGEEAGRAVFGEEVKEVSGQSSFLKKLHDFFIDDSYQNWQPVEEEAVKETEGAVSSVPKAAAGDMAVVTEGESKQPHAAVPALPQMPEGILYSYKLTGMSLPEYVAARKAVREQERRAGVAAVRRDAVNPSTAAAEAPKDLSHLVKDWDWSKSRPWAKTEEEKHSPDFLTRMRANSYAITKDEFEALINRSPYDSYDTKAYQNHLTSFEGLDPLIYGEQNQLHP